MLMTLTLPWPPSILSPNARPHYMALARAKKKYRAACAWTAAGQGARRLPSTVRGLDVRLVFVPPSRRAYDVDNAVARMKSGLDGVADVLGVDDSIFRLFPERAEEGRIGGFVVVEIRERPPETRPPVYERPAVFSGNEWNAEEGDF